MSKKTAVTERDDVECRVLTDCLELRLEGPEGAPKLIGWSPIWNSLSVDLGGFREKVMPGATRKTIREQDVPLLVNHDGLPLASSMAGSMTLAEDDRGLRFETTLDPSDPDVQRLLPKMRRGDMRKTSFAFIPTREEWDYAGKVPLRILHEISLFDVSIVHRPAYPQSEVKLRSLLGAGGVEVDAFSRVVLRVQRGLPLSTDDVALLESAITYLRSFVPSAPLEEPAQPAAPAQASHPAESDGQEGAVSDSQVSDEKASAPAQASHSLTYYEALLAKLEAGLA